MIEIYFDGACEPINPGGTASYGWLVKRDNEILKKEGKIIGSGQGMTNNVAEYTGLMRALEALPKLGIKKGKIKIYGDSNLVCNHVSKKWGWNKQKTNWVPHKDKPHLKELLDKVLTLLENYNYNIEWISQARNKEADYLSRNILIEAGIVKSDSVTEQCPQCTRKLVERKGPYGKFYGCSGYPKCKFIKKLIK